MNRIYRKILKCANINIEPAHRYSSIKKISVVVPCYNYGRFLRKCIESVIDQEELEIEIIIIDDNSDDNTASIAQSLCRDDPRIRFIRHSFRQGHIATYNQGIDAAKGEFFLLLSADDLVAPNALSRAAAFLAARPSVGLVYGNVVDFTDEVPTSRGDVPSWLIWPGAEWLEQRCRTGYNVVAGPSAVMRMSVLRAIGGYRPDLPHAGDFEMWLRASAVADIGFLIGVDQAYYRHHGVNMHKKDFKSGTPHGQFIDLKERWQSFEAVFSGIGRGLEDSPRLLQVARRTLARQALEHVNYAYARGFRDFPTARFEALACEIDPGVVRTRVGRALARRKRLGMISMPLHPFWAPSAIALRVGLRLRGWRHRRIGV
jgi:glycosyltransferase involved in cell wall biosynthesis